MQVHGINIVDIQVTMDNYEQYSTVTLVLAISKQVGFDFLFGSRGRQLITIQSFTGLLQQDSSYLLLILRGV